MKRSRHGMRRVICRLQICTLTPSGLSKRPLGPTIGSARPQRGIRKLSCSPAYRLEIVVRRIRASGAMFFDCLRIFLYCLSSLIALCRRRFPRLHSLWYRYLQIGFCRSFDICIAFLFPCFSLLSYHRFGMNLESLFTTL